MLAVILGIENVNYISRKTGDPVVGTRLYVMDYETAKMPHFIGRTATAVYVKFDVSHVHVDDVVELVYSQRVDDDKPRLMRIDKVEDALSPLTA